MCPRLPHSPRPPATLLHPPAAALAPRSVLHGLFQAPLASVTLVDRTEVVSTAADPQAWTPAPREGSLAAWSLASPQPEVVVVEDLQQDDRWGAQQACSSSRVCASPWQAAGVQQRRCRHSRHSAALAGVQVPSPLAAPPRRFRDHAQAQGHHRFYAAAPLVGAGGLRYGTLSILDTQPRCLAPDQVACLQQVAGKYWLLAAAAEAKGPHAPPASATCRGAALHGDPACLAAHMQGW